MFLPCAFHNFSDTGFSNQKKKSLLFKSSIYPDWNGNFSPALSANVTAQWEVAAGWWFSPADQVERPKARIEGRIRPASSQPGRQWHSPAVLGRKSAHTRGSACKRTRNSGANQALPSETGAGAAPGASWQRRFEDRPCQPPHISAKTSGSQGVLLPHAGKEPGEGAQGHNHGPSWPRKLTSEGHLVCKGKKKVISYQGITKWNAHNIKWAKCSH